jgi:hypothetical protein
MRGPPFAAVAFGFQEGGANGSRCVAVNPVYQLAYVQVIRSNTLRLAVIESLL